MKEREEHRPLVHHMEIPRAVEHTNVISMQEYLERHPRARQSVGQRAVRHTTQVYHQQNAQMYELFPPILVSDTPNETA